MEALLLIVLLVILSPVFIVFYMGMEQDPFGPVTHTYSDINEAIFERNIDTPSVLDLTNNEKWKVVAIQKDSVTYYDGSRLHRVDMNEEQQASLFEPRRYLIHSSNGDCDNIDTSLPPFVHTFDKVTKEMIASASYCLFIKRMSHRQAGLKRNISKIRSDMVKSLPIAKEIVSEHYASINET